jgi:tRNA A-37 threonylcarbamoyl transferase component Bud32
MQHDLTGEIIGGYLVEEEIGRGGMARVWRARHSVLQRRAALKILAPELAGDEKFVERFLREARAAAQLEHQNIVPVYETGHSNGYHFIAMKYLEGSTLGDGIERGPARPEEVSGILSQVADALDYAHSRGIVHRDVKPGNIMIDERLRVTLTDFGIARAADDMSITVTGLLVGTPAYMAPEQAQGLPATPQSDVYALGVVVYELLTGSTPFGERTPHAVILAHMHEPPQPVHERIPDTDPGISGIVGKALAKDPQERFASAGAFAQAFAEAAGTHSGPSISSPGQPVYVPAPAMEVRRAAERDVRRKRLVAGAMAGMLLIACLVLSFILWDTDDATAGGVLHVTTDPVGAMVWVNGVSQGQAPLSVNDLSPGSHTVRVEMPSYRAKEETYSHNGDDDAALTFVLQPLPSGEVVSVTRAMTTSRLRDGSGGLREPVDSQAAFSRSETVFAYALVRSDAYGVRDLDFTFTSRWYSPDGTLRATSRPQRASFSSDGQVWYLSASAVAGDIDPAAGGEACLVEFYVDDVVIQTLQFTVSDRSP